MYLVRRVRNAIEIFDCRNLIMAFVYDAKLPIPHHYKVISYVVNRKPFRGELGSQRMWKSGKVENISSAKTYLDNAPNKQLSMPRNEISHYLTI